MRTYGFLLVGFLLSFATNLVSGAAANSNGPPSDDTPVRREKTRAGYADIFPEWLLDDVFGNYEHCVRNSVVSSSDHLTQFISTVSIALLVCARRASIL